MMWLLWLLCVIGAGWSVVRYGETQSIGWRCAGAALCVSAGALSQHFL